jgi:hypothetical protein
MRRLVLYAMAIVLGVILALAAWAFPEARWAFIALGVGIVAGLAWSIRRFPKMQRVHLAVGAIVIVLSGLAIAVPLPSTANPCDCPQPRGALAGFGCNCGGPDQHWHLRIAIALIGMAAAWCLLKAGERRSRQVLVNAS